VFDTSSTNFGVSGSRQSFLKDMTSGTLEMVSLANSGGHGNALCRIPRVSNDGRYVVWNASSSCTNLVGAGDLGGADTNGFGDAYVRDRTTGTTIRASLSSSNTQGTTGPGFPTGSFNADISGNGQFVVFFNDLSDLVGAGDQGGADTNGVADIFVRDILNNQTFRVSLADDETQGSFTGITTPLGANSCGISADGRFVVFDTDAHTMDPTSADTNGVSDVYVRDRQTGQTRRVSLAPDRSQGLQGSFNAVISDDGRQIAFITASALVPTDTNGFNDVYVVANPLAP
ncbi:MAG: hypothetical protein AB1758_07275, partial [Candidatus Eremiobacterota bacterium]